MIKNPIDYLDRVGAEIYINEYEQYDKPWGKSERDLFNEALDFVFDHKMPPKGKCVEIGIYKGESFLRIVDTYGLRDCLGIDIKNYANLPNVVVKDVKEIEDSFPIKLGINDIAGNCPESKKYGHNWLQKNVVEGGLIVLTGHKDISLSGFNIKNLSVIYQNDIAIIFKKQCKSGTN